MDTKYLIYKVCPVCDGGGVVTRPGPIHEEESDCPECLGENVKHPKLGGLYVGWLEKPDE